MLYTILIIYVLVGLALFTTLTTMVIKEVEGVWIKITRYAFLMLYVWIGLYLWLVLITERWI